MTTSKTFYKLQKGRKHFKTVAEAKKYAKENKKSGNKSQKGDMPEDISESTHRSSL